MDRNYAFECSASEHEIDAHRAVVDQLRRLNDMAITLHQPPEQLRAIADQLHALSAHFEQGEGVRLREYFTPMKQLARREGLQPYAPFGGSHSPITPQLHYREEGDKIIAEASFDLLHEGPIGCVHGGVIAGVYDCVLAAAVVKHGFGGPTAQLNTRYIAPTPLKKPLVFSAWLEKVDGKKIHVAGECHCDGERLSSATALFINNLKTRS